MKLSNILACFVLVFLVGSLVSPIVRIHATTAFAAVNVTSASTCPLDTRTFVVAYSDDTNDDVSFQILDTNGTVILAETDVDTTVGATSYTSVGVSAFNSTTFVVAWFDHGDHDVTFAVYNTTGSLLSGPTDADTDVTDSFSVQVSCFNSTHFVAAWNDNTDYDITFSVYTSASTLVTGPIDVDADVDTYARVSVSAFNSTTFVLAWYDFTDQDYTFAIYDSAGTNIVAATDVDNSGGTGDYCVSVSALNSTYFVIGWGDGGDQQTDFAVYTSSGTLKTGPTIVDDNSGQPTAVKVATLTNTSFVISWYDGANAEEDLVFASYWSNGTAIASETNIENWPTSTNTPFLYQSPCSKETATDIQIYDNNWVIAYANTTTQAITKAFYPNGTTWDGNPYVTSPEPTLPSPSYNNTVQGKACMFSCQWTDDVALSGYVFGTNNTGSWVNETWTVLSGTGPEWANVTKTLTNNIGYRVEYEWWCNNTANLWSNTGILFLTTTAYAPLSETQAATNQEPITATLNGNITYVDGENCDIRGFDWGTESGTYTHTWSESGSFGVGTFNHNVTSLTENTTYYFRSFAHNGGGWGNGTELSFKTRMKLIELTDSYALRWQRKLYYVSSTSLYWFFYINATTEIPQYASPAYYATSVDGSMWSAGTYIGTAQYGWGEALVVVFDGTHFHVSIKNSDLYYMRGTPYANASIVWDTALQDSWNHTGYTQTSDHDMTVDSNGYPWQVWTYGTSTATQYAWVSKSKYNNGTYAHDTGYPMMLNYTDMLGQTPGIVALDDGAVYTVWINMGDTYMYGRHFDGATWESANHAICWMWDSQGTSSAVESWCWSLVADGTSVHMLGLTYTPDYSVAYYNWSVSQGWSSGVTLQASCVNYSSPVLTIDRTTHDLFAFWCGKPDADHIYYRRYDSDAGVWDAMVDAVDVETEKLAKFSFDPGNGPRVVDVLQTAPEVYEERLALAYTTHEATPYKIGFFLLKLYPVNLNLRILNSTGSPITEYCSVTFNNGTEYVTNVGAGGWVNFTGIWANSAAYNVTYQGVTVKEVESVVLLDNVTSDVTCDIFYLNVTVSSLETGESLNANCTIITPSMVAYGVGTQVSPTTFNNLPSQEYIILASYANYPDAYGSKTLTSNDNLTITIYTVTQVTIIEPTNTTYEYDSFSVNFTASGGTIDKQWFNVWNGSDWAYVSNQSYVTPLTLSGFEDGSYTFYAYANNTLGTEGSSSVMFTVAIKPPGGTVPPIDETPTTGGSSAPVTPPSENNTQNLNPPVPWMPVAIIPTTPQNLMWVGISLLTGIVVFASIEGSARRKRGLKASGASWRTARNRPLKARWKRKGWEIKRAWRRKKAWED